MNKFIVKQLLHFDYFLFIWVFQEMDVDAEEETQAAASQPSEMVNGHAEDDFHKTDKSKSKLSLKYSEYKSMATQLVITIRRSEERAEGGE